MEQNTFLSIAFFSRSIFNDNQYFFTATHSDSVILFCFPLNHKVSYYVAMLSAMFFFFFFVKLILCWVQEWDIYSNTLSWMHTHHHDPADPVSKQGAGEKNHTHRGHILQQPGRVFIDTKFLVFLLWWLYNRNYYLLGIRPVPFVNKLGRHLQVAAAFVIQATFLQEVNLQGMKPQMKHTSQTGVDRSIQSSFTVMELGLMTVLII